jgi:hypothetical protein
VTSGGGNHNDNCANAKGRICRCTGCGGSLHGWGGWVSLANQVDHERQTRRKKANADWQTYYDPQRKRSNQKSKAACADLARLDIADWLARQAHPRPTDDTSYFEVVVPEQRSPPTATIGAGRQPEPDDPRTRSLGVAPESQESQQPGQAKPGDGSKNLSRPESQSEAPELGQPDDVPPYLSADDQSGNGPEGHSRAERQSERSERGESDVPPSAVEQVKIFAEAMTDKSTWADISAQLSGDAERVRDIKRQLAYHGWCDLFIGLVQVIEACREVLDRIPDAAKNIVKEAIRCSSMQAKRPYVTDDVVDVVVDRVWEAFKGAMVGHVPLLSIITDEDALRSLRILAVFTCPAPEKHKEVREHALKPLGDDVERILTDQTKARLKELFVEWTSDLH